MRSMWFHVILYAATGVIAFVMVFSVRADQFQSPRYRIESGNVSLQPDLDQGSTNYDLSSSFGPDSQKNFENKGYVAVMREDADSSGRPYIRIQLSNSQLVFDSADVRDEAVQKSTVKLVGQGVTRFILATRQEDRFKNSFGATLESTRCDNDSSPCTPTFARSWKKAFGFGYRVDDPSMKDFVSAQAFRPFFIGGSTGRSAVLFNGELDKNGKSLDLEFKLRPQPQTQTGIYKSTIIITATADY